MNSRPYIYGRTVPPWCVGGDQGGGEVCEEKRLGDTNMKGAEAGFVHSIHSH